MILWNMFSELEQTESLIQSGGVDREEADALDPLARELGRRICPLTDFGNLSPEGLPKGELYYVIHRYLENANALVNA